MDPGWPLNTWYLANREGSPLQVANWEEFRDPYKLTYRDYVSMQHDREIYLDALVDKHEAADSVAALDPGWVETQRKLFVPLRFPLHVLPMTSLYVGQMAPSPYITNCAHFQAADEMRRGLCTEFARDSRRSQDWTQPHRRDRAAPRGYLAAVE